MWSLSHQNATCNFLGGKLKYFDRCKKASRTTNVAYKCYTYFHFHQQSTIISFHMKIGKNTCYTNKNIYEKKFRISTFYVLFILNLLFIRKHMHPSAKTTLPAKRLEYTRPKAIINRSCSIQQRYPHRPAVPIGSKVTISAPRLGHFPLKRNHKV